MADPRIQRAALHLNDHGILTDNELDAYALHAAGYGYYRIALQLGLSTSTARDRVRRAQRKLLTYLQENPDAAA